MSQTDDFYKQAQEIFLKEGKIKLAIPRVDLTVSLVEQSDPTTIVISTAFGQYRAKTLAQAVWLALVDLDLLANYRKEAAYGSAPIIDPA